jgi:hypothetical protein
MALTSNTYSQGALGLSQEHLVNYIQHLTAAVYKVCGKLDNDGGVTDTNYGATVQAILASGAQLKGVSTIAVINA